MFIPLKLIYRFNKISMLLGFILNLQADFYFIREYNKLKIAKIILKTKNVGELTIFKIHILKKRFSTWTLSTFWARWFFPLGNFAVHFMWLAASLARVH